MQIQINTDRNIEGREGLSAHVSNVIEHALNHTRNQITRVEVHLADENGSKSGQDDKRCVMEARLEHHQPVVVTHHAASLHQAVEGAAHKLTRLIDSTIGRLHDQKTRNDPVVIADPDIPEA
jgi:ribosome-associated translation inhibitor RaiA